MAMTNDEGPARGGRGHGDRREAARRLRSALGPVPPELAEAERLRTTLARLVRTMRREHSDGHGPLFHAALITVLARGPLPQGDLAAAERVASPTMTRVVDRLEEAGFVERTPSPDDARVRLVSITDAGRDYLRESRDERSRWLADRLAQLVPADRVAIAGALDALEHLVADLPDPSAGRGRRGAP